MNDFSDSEPDISQYQAEVGSTFQTVALVSNQPVSRMHQSSSSPKSLNLDHRKKIPLSDDLKADELSLSSLSNQSVDFKDEDDMDDDLDAQPKPKQSSAVMSSTSTAGDPKLVNGNFLQSASTSSAPVLNSNSSERIPEYSAADEARNVRNFQLITLPDGKTREIDMKVSF